MESAGTEGWSYLGWRDGVSCQPTWALEDLITAFLDLTFLRGGTSPLSSFKCLLFLLFSLLRFLFVNLVSAINLRAGVSPKKDALTSLRDNGSCQKFEGLHS